jgi:hypothetical protein
MPVTSMGMTRLPGPGRRGRKCYWVWTVGEPCSLVTGGGFHLPVSASDLGA